MDNLFVIAEQFIRQGNIVSVHEYGQGNINDTFLVTMDAGMDRHWILQRINAHVFRRPELIMHNVRIATDHMLERLAGRKPGEGRRWEVPRVLLTGDGRDHMIRPDGSFWRGLSFIEGCRSFDVIADDLHAGEVGYALGMFHSLLSDLPPGMLKDTLEGFHITPLYLRHYRDILAKRGAKGSAEERYCAQFVEERAPWASVLEDAKAEGKLRLLPVHGDPKINNIMIDVSSDQAVGVVDLDTVKPGLVHYDIGDCLRSACNPLGEETEEWENARFDTDICRAVLRGYLFEARRFLTENDFIYFFDAVRLIAFELGLRFFTDHLEGNVYFKVKRPGHNLARALVQLKLAASIELQEAAVRAIVREMR